MNRERDKLVKVVSSAAHTAKAYDLISETYADTWFDRPAKRLANKFLGHLPNGSLILDLGCGPGQYTLYFLNNGYEAIGVDISMMTLIQAVKRTRKSLFSRMSMTQIGLRNSSIDGVWACSSFVHIPKQQAVTVLKEISRVLKPGGIWFLNVQKGKVSRIETPEEFSQGEEYGRFFQRYEVSDKVANYMHKCGLEVLECWEEIVTSTVLSMLRTTLRAG
jgi:ubiquinone/menaquinone biosynthesis C-methylase UbiE